MLAVLLSLPAAGLAAPRSPALDEAGRLLGRDDVPGAWSLAAIPPGPDGRLYPQISVSPELGVAVVFGGSTEHGMDNDTYWMDVRQPEAGWRALSPGALAPAPRFLGTTAWDPDAHRMLLFGGIGDATVVDQALLFGNNFFNDVWALQFDPGGVAPPTWQKLSGVDLNPLEVPSKRAGSVGVYDPVGKRLIVHGGNETARALIGQVGEIGEGWTGIPTAHQGLDDVWAFSPATSGWQKLAGGLPGDEPALLSHQGVYDPVGHQLVVTGGLQGYDPYSSDLKFNDRTWSFDLSAKRWTEWAATGESPAMAYAAFGYSAERKALIVARGRMRGDSDTAKTPVYALRLGPAGAGAGWEALPTKGRPHPVFPFEGTSGAVGGEVMVLMGGTHQWSSNEGLDLDAAFSAFDLGATRWSQLSSDAAAMAPTAEATAVYDSARRHMLVVGGRGRPGAVWDLDLAAGSWTRIVAAGEAPEDDKRMLAAFDSARGRLLVLSGKRVHALSLGQQPRWAVLKPLGDAPSLVDAHAFYDPRGDRVLLVGGRFLEPEYSYYFGGFQQPDHNNKVFALHLSGVPAWRELSSAGQAPERTDAAAAFDAERNRILLFGGRDPATNNLISTVSELSLEGEGSWRDLTPTGSAPTERYGPAVAIDAANDRLLLYGGKADDPATYALSLVGGPAWSKLATTGDPLAVRHSAAVYDAAASRFVTFGGYREGDNTDLAGTRDAFALELGGAAPTVAAGEPVTYAPPPRSPVLGGTWSSLGPAGSRIVPVAVSPAFATDRTVYAGTINRPKTQNASAGIYVSRDAGASWHPAAGDALGAAITRIAPSPSDAAVVYAAGRSGEGHVPVYRSLDAGQSWTAASEGLPGGAYFGLAVHPTEPAVAWAAGDRGGLYRTADGGASWDSLGFEDEWVYGLAAVPLAGGGARLLAATRDPSSAVHGSGRAYLSDDLGQTWDLVHYDDDYVTYGFAYDPSDPDLVLMTAGNGIWRSEDRGETFEWLDDRAIQAAWLAFDPTSGGEVVYAGGVAMPVNFSGIAGGTVSPAQTPGLWRSVDGGISWTMVEGAPEEDFGGVAVSPDGSFVIGGSLETGPHVSTNGGASFVRRASGFPQTVAASISVDAVNPQRLVAAGEYAGALVSQDGGKSWFSVGLEGGQPLWYAAASPVKGGRVLGGNYSNLYKSENGGLTWSVVGLPDNDSPGTYYRQPGGFAFHPTQENTWYVTTSTRKVLKTTDNGQSFTSGTIGQFGACLIPLAVSPAAPQRLLVGDTCGQGVLRSDDGGATWQPSTSGLDDGNVTALAFHPTDPDLAWAGTLHRGVYRSADGGRTWAPARAGLGYRYVRFLTVDPGGRLFAAVRAGGVFESDDGGASWTPVGDGLVSRDPIHVLADAGGRVLTATNGGGVSVISGT